MLELRPNCECCNIDLAAHEQTAYICSFECTFCDDCREKLHSRCPNCGGELVRRPTRTQQKLENNPASAIRVFKPNGCSESIPGNPVPPLRDSAL
ncbi:TPA: DUF1272 domain-containing protein [Raoultella planticola]